MEEKNLKNAETEKTENVETNTEAETNIEVKTNIEKPKPEAEPKPDAGKTFNHDRDLRHKIESERLVFPTKEHKDLSEEEVITFANLFKQFEIAWMFGVSQSAVSQRQHAVRRRLAKYIPTGNEIQGFVEKQRQLLHTLPPGEERKNLGEGLRMAGAIIFDLLSQKHKIDPRVYLEVANLAITLDKAKVEILSKMLGISAQKKFNALIIEEIAAEAPAVKERIIEKMKKSPELKWFLG